jgi:sialic acid synthase SpsE
MALNPQELKETINAIRQTESAMGNEHKQILDSEKENRNKLRKSIVANTEIPSGTIITEKMIAVKRPGGGLEPSQWGEVIGRKASKLIENNSLLEETMFE